MRVGLCRLRPNRQGLLRVGEQGLGRSTLEEIMSLSELRAGQLVMLLALAASSGN